MYIFTLFLLSRGRPGSSLNTSLSQSWIQRHFVFFLYIASIMTVTTSYYAIIRYSCTFFTAVSSVKGTPTQLMNPQPLCSLANSDILYSICILLLLQLLLLSTMQLFPIFCTFFTAMSTVKGTPTQLMDFLVFVKPSVYRVFYIDNVYCYYYNYLVCIYQLFLYISYATSIVKGTPTQLMAHQPLRSLACSDSLYHFLYIFSTFPTLSTAFLRSRLRRTDVTSLVQECMTSLESPSLIGWAHCGAVETSSQQECVFCQSEQLIGWISCSCGGYESR